MPSRSTGHASAPKHPRAFLLRRGANWLPLGLGYAALYMGRYNINVAQSALGEQVFTRAMFGNLFAIGALVYSVSFLVNGPLTDRYGGRRTMLLGMGGALLANALMGVVLYGRALLGWQLPLFGTFAVLYGMNMYFQSFAAAAIVTTKNPWFHVRERGRFSTVFGFMISFGLYLAFDWGYAIIAATRAKPQGELGVIASAFHALFGAGHTEVNGDWWLFFTPALLLAIFWVVVYLLVRNTPGEAGFMNFDTGQESLSREGERLPALVIFRKIINHPVLRFSCLIEFCSGVMRNGSIQWYPKLAEAVGFKKSFAITANWGLALLICGIIGGTLTGMLSDKLFGSRRAPMVTILYGVMTVMAIVICATLRTDPQLAGYAILVMCTSVIGVHSIKAGTMTADFGGRNAGSAVAIVDGMVYLGTSLQSTLTGYLVPVGTDAAKDPGAWMGWALLFLPFAFVGCFAATRIWHALPQKVREAADARQRSPDAV